MYLYQVVSSLFKSDNTSILITEIMIALANLGFDVLHMELTDYNGYWTIKNLTSYIFSDTLQSTGSYILRLLYGNQMIFIGLLPSTTNQSRFLV